MPPTDSTAPIGLLTIGNVGVGKSFLQDTIAGRAVFQTARRVRAVTAETTSHTVVVDGKAYKLFDIPGLIEMGNEQKIESNKTAIDTAFSQCSQQIVLVVMGHLNLRPQAQDVATFLAVRRAYELHQRSVIFVVNQIRADDEDEDKADFTDKLRETLKEAEACPDDLRVVFCIDIGRNADFAGPAAQTIRRQLLDAVAASVAHAHTKKHAIELRHAELEQLRKKLEELEKQRCEHAWHDTHRTLLNQQSSHEERHHTGNWGGFMHGWSCCGKGGGNFSWNHNDCRPRTVTTNRLVCSFCGRESSSQPCSKTCSLCAVVTVLA